MAAMLSDVSSLSTLLLPRANHTHNGLCTLETCTIPQSAFGYAPSIPANALFIAIFAISLAANVVQGALYRKLTLSYALFLLANNTLEVVGYAGRVAAHHNPFLRNPYIIQICCLTIGPVFICAGLYLSLGWVVQICGPRISYLKPRTYAKLFISCDVASLLLQAAGGGLASAESNQNKPINTGNHIMLAGVIIQVCTLTVFMLLGLDCLRRGRALTKAAALAGEPDPLEPAYAPVRARRRFRWFLGALALSTACVYIRSIYRVVEMADGWNGVIIKTQSYFIGFEGVLMSIAVLVLNAWHPGWCLWTPELRKRDAQLLRDDKVLRKEKKAEAKAEKGGWLRWGRGKGKGEKSVESEVEAVAPSEGSVA